MSTQSRLSSSPVRTARNAVSRRVHRGPLSALLLAGIALLLAVLVAPAGAVVTEVGASTVGAQPREAEKVSFGQGALAESFNNPTGNPVLHATRTYSIYWDPTNNYHSDWMNLINTFFHDFGSESGAGNLSTVFSVDTQYTDRTNQPASYASTFEGSYHDTNAYPSSGCTDPNPPALEDRVVINKAHTIVCLTDKQVQEEVKRMISQHALPTGMGTVYYLLTPPSIAVCLDAGGSTGHCSDYTGSVGGSSYKQSFCSYHSAVNPGKLATGDANTVLYAAIPWTAGGLGDGKLSGQSPAFDCQDGGFDASNTKEVEPREKQKIKSKKEEEALEEKNPEEKKVQEEAEALEGPHQQEPNQGGCPSEDGFCDHGLADLIINQVAVEQQNAVTNPLLNAWQDSARNEATDECRNFFALTVGGSLTAEPLSRAGTLYNQSINGGTYYLNDAFNAAGNRLAFPGLPCKHGVNLIPRFTAPNPVNSGELVGLNGMESLVDLNSTIGYPVSGEGKVTYATYTWNFGDGTPVVSGFAPGSPSQNAPELTQCEAPWIAPCAGSVFHSYQYGGTYEATLTIHDVGGHTASVTKSITVDGPARPTPPEPAPAPAPAPAPPPAPGVTTGGKTGGGSVGSTTTTRPVATQAVTSHSLASVLRGGLVIKYSVNEQVAGRFEVLLASSIARRIGLHGPAATGLAKGTAAQMVIAKAVLVTTKGGHSTYKIKFSKATAARLRKLKKVSLMIRLVVHNASSPVATTVLNTVDLAR